LLLHLQEAGWPVSVITFNYDVGLDYALRCAGKQVDYGLTSARTGAIEVLKLHGSLNWFRSQDQIVVAELAPQVALSRERYSAAVSVPVTELFAPEQTLPAPDDPVIVPPTWNKGQYHREFQGLWARAALHLAEAENIVVIGYSAPETDQFYRHLYALSTISDTLLSKYLCIGPNVAQKHQRLMGGVGQARNAFQATNDTFSRCYPWLLQQLGLEQAGGLFADGSGLGQRLSQLAAAQPAQAFFGRTTGRF
jgi:hypothetical protein